MNHMLSLKCLNRYLDAFKTLFSAKRHFLAFFANLGVYGPPLKILITSNPSNHLKYIICEPPAQFGWFRYIRR